MLIGKVDEYVLRIVGSSEIRNQRHLTGPPPRRGRQVLGLMMEERQRAEDRSKKSE